VQTQFDSPSVTSNFDVRQSCYGDAGAGPGEDSQAASGQQNVNVRLNWPRGSCRQQRHPLKEASENPLYVRWCPRKFRSILSRV
jgi:hypothetical protein